MTTKFNSGLSTCIDGFLEQKRKLGFPYEVSAYYLVCFDKHCAELFPLENTLTKEMAFSWAVRKETESNNSFRNRMMPIRELARYMLRLGVSAYIIPEKLTNKDPRYIPHIFSSDELKKFFDILDRIPQRKISPARHLVIPIIFRVLYCCGLRPAEARKLRVEHVDLTNGRIMIVESKGHKDRIVMLADDILALCRQYNEKMQIIMPGREAFFPNEKGQAYSKIWFSFVFRKYWNETGFPQFGANPPRVYDFRHTFATHRLHQWMLEGKNLSACLPYLSAYLGHVLLSDTAYYIHLIPSFFKESPEIVGFHKCERLLPEVGK
jgi:integrase